MNELQFIKKNIYGRYLYFPCNDLAIKTLETLLPTKKTFTSEQIKLFKELELKIKIIVDED